MSTKLMVRLREWAPGDLPVLLEACGAERLPAFVSPRLRIARAIVPDGGDVDAVLTALNARPEVEHAERLGTVEPHAFTRGSFDSQLALGDTWAIRRMNVPRAWRLIADALQETLGVPGLRGDPAVRVGLTDSGVFMDPARTFQPAHPQLPALKPGHGYHPVTLWPFPTEYHPFPGGLASHGTGVLGCIVARADDSAGIAGVAPDCTYVMASLTDPDDGNWYHDVTLDALAWIRDQDVEILNASWGYVRPAAEVPNPNYEPAYHDHLVACETLGISTVGTAANDGYDLDSGQWWVSPGMDPAQDLLISSIRDNDAFETVWANYGTAVDVAAPGEGLRLLGGSTGEIVNGGTSFAAPFTAGVLALILSANRALTRAERRAILLETADASRNPAAFDPYLPGRGIPDAGRAVARALSTNPAFAGRIFPYFRAYNTDRLTGAWDIMSIANGACTTTLNGNLELHLDAYSRDAQGAAVPLTALELWIGNRRLYRAANPTGPVVLTAAATSSGAPRRLRVVATTAGASKTEILDDFVVSTLESASFESFGFSVDPAPPVAQDGTLVISGFRSAGATVTVTCGTATVGAVSYPTSTTWQATLSGLAYPSAHSVVASDGTTTTTVENVGSASRPVAETPPTPAADPCPPEPTLSAATSNGSPIVALTIGAAASVTGYLLKASSVPWSTTPGFECVPDAADVWSASPPATWTAPAWTSYQLHLFVRNAAGYIRRTSQPLTVNMGPLEPLPVQTPATAQWARGVLAPGDGISVCRFGSVNHRYEFSVTAWDDGEQGGVLFGVVQDNATIDSADVTGWAAYRVEFTRNRTVIVQGADSVAGPWTTVHTLASPPFAGGDPYLTAGVTSGSTWKGGYVVPAPSLPGATVAAGSPATWNVETPGGGLRLRGTITATEPGVARVLVGGVPVGTVNFAGDTVHGMLIPNSRPRIFYDAARLAQAQAWYASNPFTPSQYRGLQWASYALRGLLNNEPAQRQTAVNWAVAFHPAPTWLPSTVYVLDDLVLTNDGTARAYRCIQAGTSSATPFANGGGPRGTAADIADGTVRWEYYRPASTGPVQDNYRWHGEAIALIYDWCYDTFTPSERAELIRSWNVYYRYQMNYTWAATGGPSGSRSGPMGNYYWGVIRSTLLWGLATYHENQAAAETFIANALTARYAGEFVPLVNSTVKGGIGTDSSHYGPYTRHYAGVAFEAARVLGRNLWAETPWWRESVFATIYQFPGAQSTQRHSGVDEASWDYFPFGDEEPWNTTSSNGGDQARLSTQGNFLTTAAKLWPETNVARYASQYLATVAPVVDEQVRSVQGTLPSPLAFSNLPLDYYASGPSYLYGHSSSNWAAGTAFVIQMGYGQVEGHHHDDFGSFQLWRAGRWVTRETTEYSDTIVGYGGATVGILTPAAHNVLLVGGVGPRHQNPLFGADPVTTRVQSAPGFAFIAASIGNTYQSGVTSLVRECIFVRDLETLIVLDRIQATSAASARTFLLHGENDWTAIDGSHRSCTTGAQQAYLTTLLPAAPTYRVVAEGGAHGQYRLEVEDAPGTAQSYMLNVIETKPSADSPLAPTISDGGTHWIITLDATHSVRLEKGMTSSGGSVTIDGVTTPLRADVQPISVTDDGPAWGA